MESGLQCNLTQHPDGLSPWVRDILTAEYRSSVDGSSDATVGLSDGVDHPRVEEGQEEDWDQVKEEE